MAVLNQAFIPYCARYKQKEVTLRWNKWPNSYSNETCSSLILVKTWLAVGTCPRNINRRLAKHASNYRSVPRQPVNLLAVEYKIYCHFLPSRSITVSIHVNLWRWRDCKVYDKSQSIRSVNIANCVLVCTFQKAASMFPDFLTSLSKVCPFACFRFLHHRYIRNRKLSRCSLCSCDKRVDFFRNPSFPALEIYIEKSRQGC